MRSTPLVYVGTSLNNAAVAKTIMDRFISEGIKITYDWTIHGRVTAEEELISLCEKEVNGVKSADLFFMIQPGRSGTHVELGIAIGRNIPVVLIHDEKIEQKTFYYAKNVFRFSTIEEGFEFAIDELRKQYNNVFQITDDNIAKP